MPRLLDMGRLTLFDRGLAKNNAFGIGTKGERWKKWGRSFKTSTVGGTGWRFLHSHLQPATRTSASPAETQQWQSCTCPRRRSPSQVQVSPPGRLSLGSLEHCWRTQGLGTPGNLRVLRDPRPHILYYSLTLPNDPSWSLVIATNAIK